MAKSDFSREGTFLMRVGYFLAALGLAMMFTPEELKVMAKIFKRVLDNPKDFV